MKDLRCYAFCYLAVVVTRYSNGLRHLREGLVVELFADSLTVVREDYSKNIVEFRPVFFPTNLKWGIFFFPFEALQDYYYVNNIIDYLLL